MEIGNVISMIRRSSRIHQTLSRTNLRANFCPLPRFHTLTNYQFNLEKYRKYLNKYLIMKFQRCACHAPETRFEYQTGISRMRFHRSVGGDIVRARVTCELEMFNEYLRYLSVKKKEEGAKTSALNIT